MEQSEAAGGKKVFYIYDERMLKHREFPKPPRPSAEGEPAEKVHINPEIPDRIARIHQHLDKEGYLDLMQKVDVDCLDEIETLLAKIHSPELISLVRSSCEKLSEGESSWACNPGKGEIYECKDSFEAAKVSAAAAVTGVRKILGAGSEERGYCIIRPPGHHAYHNVASGFCFFNNAALAAQVAMEEPYGLKRVCIFDWDIHHGDGTQSIFYNDKRLLYVSLHRRDNLTFYPNKIEGGPEYVGEGDAKGFNVNVAWETGLEVDEFDRMNNKVSTLGNHEYRYACDTLLFPIIEEFKPELVIVSCGFDSAIHDFLGWSSVTPLMYEYMTRRLGQICPKVLVVQEGGYNIDYLGQHASGVVSGLSNDMPMKPTPADHDSGIKESLDEVDIGQAKDWAKANVEQTRSYL